MPNARKPTSHGAARAFKLSESSSETVKKNRPYRVAEGIEKEFRYCWRTPKSRTFHLVYDFFERRGAGEILGRNVSLGAWK